ncbi:MAG: NUDIX hydrolase [Verrucomicrobia bacterium]|nr:MAG: NUDIX hydrolase [Verrucomicrobiota bacterium]
MDSVDNEIFDVVDSDDHVVGQAVRSEVHRLGLKHRAVHILISNCRGEIFLQKRSMTKDSWPGAWDSSASGHVDTGEDYDAAAIRELKEELSWELAGPLKPVIKIDACADTGQEFAWVYRLEADGPFTLHPEEIDDGRWFSCREVERLLRNPGEQVAASFRWIWTELKAGGHVS